MGCLIHPPIYTLKPSLQVYLEMDLYGHRVKLSHRLSIPDTLGEIQLWSSVVSVCDAEMSGLS